MREINLCGLGQAGLIVLLDSGTRYQNQTGGDVSEVMSAEGFFAPMDNEMLVDGIAYQQFFQTLSEMTINLTQLDETLADQIDRLIETTCLVDEIKVDRQRLSESRAAWLYVSVVPGDDITDFSGFDPFQAVLTWPN